MQHRYPTSLGKAADAEGIPKDRIATIKLIDARIALRLRVARHESSLSQEMVGEAIGVSFQQIQKYEKGSNRISPGKLAMLAELYGKPVAWFYQGLENTDMALPRDLVEQVLDPQRQTPA